MPVERVTAASWDFPPFARGRDVRDDWVKSDTVGSPGMAERNDSKGTLTGLRDTVSASEEPPRPSLRLPTVVGPYRLRQKLGEGGMGEVHEAIHETLERQVAIKFLRAPLQDSNAGRRLLTEARATNRIRHSGLIEVSDSGVLPDGTAYIVMELLRGETLARRAQRVGGKLPLALTLHLGWQIASTLAAAHQKGIIHRDLKPENVMLVPDNLAPLGERAKLLDFGLAKLLLDAAQSPGMTQSQQVLGTPLYMSPEQCRGAGAVDEKTDVYSLGVLLYALLAGRTPFTGEGVGDLIHQHMGHAPPPLAGFEPTLPPAVVGLIHRLLGKSAAERPRMTEVVEDLARLYAELASPSGQGTVTDTAAQPGRTDSLPPDRGPHSVSSGEKKESAPLTPDGFLADPGPAIPAVAVTIQNSDAPVHSESASSSLVGSHSSLAGAAAGVFASPSWGRRMAWLGLPALLMAGLLTRHWFRPPPEPPRPLPGVVGAAHERTSVPPSPAQVLPASATPPAPVGSPAPAPERPAAPTPANPPATARPSQAAQSSTNPQVAAPARAPVRRSAGKGTSPPRRTIFRVIDD